MSGEYRKSTKTNNMSKTIKQCCSPHEHARSARVFARFVFTQLMHDVLDLEIDRLLLQCCILESEMNTFPLLSRISIFIIAFFSIIDGGKFVCFKALKWICFNIQSENEFVYFTSQILSLIIFCQEISI